MDYISNVTLSILLQLHRAHELCFQVHDSTSLEQLKEYAYRIEYLLKNKPEGLSDSEDEEFEDNYEPCITYTTTFCSVNLKCENRKHIEDYLNNYIAAYKNDDLKEYGNKNEYERIDVLNQELREKVESSKNSLKQYIVTKLKYMPTIVDNYLQNNDFIRDMNIKLASDEEVEYPLIIFIHADSDDLDSINPDWEEFFDYKFVLDMDWYLNEYNKSISKTVVRERRKKLAPTQQKVYNYLLRNAKAGVFVLSREDLKNCLLLSSKDKTLNELRVQYREIFNIPTDFNIISYNRTTQLYDIHKDILKYEL